MNIVIYAQTKWLSRTHFGPYSSIVFTKYYAETVISGIPASDARNLTLRGELYLAAIHGARS